MTEDYPDVKNDPVSVPDWTPPDDEPVLVPEPEEPAQV